MPRPRGCGPLLTWNWFIPHTHKEHLPPGTVHVYCTVTPCSPGSFLHLESQPPPPSITPGLPAKPTPFSCMVTLVNPQDRKGTGDLGHTPTGLTACSSQVERKILWLSTALSSKLQTTPHQIPCLTVSWKSRRIGNSAQSSPNMVTFPFPLQQVTPRTDSEARNLDAVFDISIFPASHS